jgi:hypothetical protein
VPRQQLAALLVYAGDNDLGDGQQMVQLYL